MWPQPANQLDRISTEGQGCLAAADEISAAPSTDEQPRQRAARDREAAARDRVEAGLDRAQAATDRELARNGIANEMRDHLTGAMGSQFGIAALRREILRTERSDEMLLVAFIEAVGVEAAEIESRQAGRDRVLRDVAVCLSDNLRDYDLIARSPTTDSSAPSRGRAGPGARSDTRRSPARMLETVG